MRPCFAYFRDSAATSISFSTARVSAQMVGQVTAFEISTTDLKSPGLEMGNPASITSTPNCSRTLATSTFSIVFSWQPGTCSPSLSVVSKIYMRLLSITVISVSYTHLRAHETRHDLVCRLLLEKKKKKQTNKQKKQHKHKNKPQTKKKKTHNN